MAYIDPRMVLSPKGRLVLQNVIYDGGEGSYSVAELEWDGQSTLGIRWNGGGDDGPLGNPQSRGIPTWFILPDSVAMSVKHDLQTETNGTSIE